MVPPVAHYEPAPGTQEDIDYAAVPIIDFAKVQVGTPEGRAELLPQVRDAMSTHGFMCVVNHGLAQGQNDRMVDIADVPFSAVPDEEQARFLTKVRVKPGDWRGYKPRQFWHLENGVRDQIQNYAIVRPTCEQQHPKALHPFLPEIHEFMAYNHLNVVHPILRLLALGLEVPEETFVEQHRFDAEGMSFLRFTKYFPRSAEDEEKTKNVWMKGHTDSGTISLLWSQPVVALQIMSTDGKWRYVKHVPNGIIVNAGDAMEMLSGGYYKAAVHRVVQPPPDQRGYTRLGLIYFAFTDDDVKLVPVAESPVLQRVGITRKCDDAEAPTMKTWGALRAGTYGKSVAPGEPERKANGVEEEVLNGIVIRHYN